MSESRVCPGCEAELAADATWGLCHTCRLDAAANAFRAILEGGSSSAIDDPLTETDTSSAEPEMVAPAIRVDVDQFKLAVLELGLVRASELELAAPRALSVPALSKELVAAGLLTSYQVGAIAQGKARGLSLGNYVILDKLGAGGMGIVFKAKHRRLGRTVALKILPPSLAREPILLSRFRREIQVAARLSHPNIVSVLDADEDRGVQFMTMEYIKGNDLDRLVKEGGALPVDLALDCSIQAARGLEAAHAAGIVHRDIKPGNLMLDESGVVRVLDLGLARVVEASNPFAQTTSGPLTQSGVYMGTVDFMAPEQGIDSRRVDHRADIYSLGATLCYLLTARPPFGGANVLARMMAHQESAPASLREARPEVSRAVDAVYHKMMAKKPTDRPASMNEVVALLDACRAPFIDAEEAPSELPLFARSGAVERRRRQAKIHDVALTTDQSNEFSFDPAPASGEPSNEIRDPRPADDPAQVPAVAKPNRLFETPSSSHSRKPIKWRSAAVALVALVGLASALAGFGIHRITRPRAGTIETRLPSQALNSKLNRDSAPASVAAGQAIRSPAMTFDVETFYKNLAAPWRAVAVSADGRHALVGGQTEQLDLLSVANGNYENLFGSHYGSIADVAMTADGRRALVGADTAGKWAHLKKEGGTLWFWDLATHKPLFPMQQPYQSHVAAVAITADGRLGLSGGRNGELTLWDLTTGQSLRELIPQHGGISPHAVAFFPDGARAATAGRDGLVHIWDVATGRQVATWSGHDGRITGLAISADGGRVVTGSDDASVILWNAENGEVVKRFILPENDTGARVAFDHDGNIVAAGNGRPGPGARPGNLFVWDARTYECLRRDEKPFARHFAVATLPRGRLLTCDEYAIRLWTPRPAGTGVSPPPTTSPSPKTPVDLIALLFRLPHKAYGKWESHGGGLLSPTTRYASVRIPFEAPSAYRLRMKVELVGQPGDNPLGLGLAIAGRHAGVSIDKLLSPKGRQARSLIANDRYSGLEEVDGVPVPFGPKPYHGQLLFRSRPVQFEITVHPDSIRLTCDGVEVVDWSGDPMRIIPHLHWRSIAARSLFLNTNTSVLIHEMTLTPLSIETH